VIPMGCSSRAAPWPASAELFSHARAAGRRLLYFLVTDLRQQDRSRAVARVDASVGKWIVPGSL
jgi:hypothetical protein